MNLWEDAEWLKEQYYDYKKSATQIAEECGCSDGKIRYWMNKHGIETRDDINARNVAVEQGRARDGRGRLPASQPFVSISPGCTKLTILQQADVVLGHPDAIRGFIENPPGTGPHHWRGIGLLPVEPESKNAYVVTRHKGVVRVAAAWIRNELGYNIKADRYPLIFDLKSELWMFYPAPEGGDDDI